MNEEDLIMLLLKRDKSVKYNKAEKTLFKRWKFLDSLNHDPHFDERYTTWFSSFRSAIKSLHIDPKADVYIVSDACEIDQTYMSFEDAIFEVPNHGLGTVIGITPNLAIYYGERGGRVAIIQRPDDETDVE